MFFFFVNSSRPLAFSGKPYLRFNDSWGPFPDGGKSLPCVFSLFFHCQFFFLGSLRPCCLFFVQKGKIGSSICFFPVTEFLVSFILFVHSWQIFCPRRLSLSTASYWGIVVLYLYLFFSLFFRFLHKPSFFFPFFPLFFKCQKLDLSTF